MWQVIFSRNVFIKLKLLQSQLDCMHKGLNRVLAYDRLVSVTRISQSVRQSAYWWFVLLMALIFQFHFALIHISWFSLSSHSNIFDYYGTMSSCTHGLFSNMLVNLQAFWRSCCNLFIQLYHFLPLHWGSIIYGFWPLKCSLATVLTWSMLVVSLVCLIYVTDNYPSIVILYGGEHMPTG